MKFDEYIGIDWSGAKSPQKSYSISVASCKQSEKSAPTAVLYKLARSNVAELIQAKLSSNQKTLIGIDCNFGYCAQVAQSQFGKNASYKEMWQAVDEINAEHTNFFAGNFWSTPPFSEYFWTSGKQPAWFSAEKLRRKTESASIEQKLGIPESPFKLIGAKQVGKGGLAGMRMLHQLKQKYGDKLAVWPFEQGLIQSAPVVITEIYPRLFIKQAGFGNNKIRDIDELNKVLNYFNSGSYSNTSVINDHLTDAIIASAGLKHHFENANPLALNLPAESLAIEGWIFGVNI